MKENLQHFAWFGSHFPLKTHFFNAHQVSAHWHYLQMISRLSMSLVVHWVFQLKRCINPPYPQIFYIIIPIVYNQINSINPWKLNSDAGITHTCNTLKVNAHHVPTSQAWYNPLEIPLDVHITHSANACIKQIIVHLARVSHLQGQNWNPFVYLFRWFSEHIMGEKKSI